MVFEVERVDCGFPFPGRRTNRAAAADAHLRVE
jgi:hypothetical protein